MNMNKCVMNFLLEKSKTALDRKENLWKMRDHKQFKLSMTGKTFYDNLIKNNQTALKAYFKRKCVA